MHISNKDVTHLQTEGPMNMYCYFSFERQEIELEQIKACMCNTHIENIKGMCNLHIQAKALSLPNIIKRVYFNIETEQLAITFARCVDYTPTSK